MDQSVQRLLNDKLYDKRKQGALEYVKLVLSFFYSGNFTDCYFSFRNRLEKIVRDATIKGEHDKIREIVDQLCHDYAYAVHQPHARNGGLIGLAAASIALGSVGGYLQVLIVTWLMVLFTGRRSSLSARNRSSGARLFLGSRCKSEVLCM